MIHTCLACGLEDRDVAMRLITIPAAEQRVVQVAISTAEDRRGVKGFEYVDVRERYAPEPRCRDKAACADRVKAMEPATDQGGHEQGPATPGVNTSEPAAVEPAAVEEGPSWLL